MLLCWPVPEARTMCLNASCWYFKIVLLLYKKWWADSGTSAAERTAELCSFSHTQNNIPGSQHSGAVCSQPFATDSDIACSGAWPLVWRGRGESGRPPCPCIFAVHTSNWVAGLKCLITYSCEFVNIRARFQNWDGCHLFRFFTFKHQTTSFLQN